MVYVSLTLYLDSQEQPLLQTLGKFVFTQLPWYSVP